jgi:hypothetical protein
MNILSSIFGCLLIPLNSLCPEVVEYLPPLMMPTLSLPCTQEPNTEPFFDTHESSLHPQALLLEGQGCRHAFSCAKISQTV